ncbi:MAG: hypothetical protein GEU86_12855 [Actinophytocola sp.]|nr:hypothetical protein [Actinophytocola sp.]
MPPSTLRRALATGTVVLALAATPHGVAAASDPVVIDQCESTARGEQGQRVLLEPSAVESAFLEALRPLDPLNAIRPRFREVWCEERPILIGAIVADTVLQRLDAIEPVGSIHDALEDAAWTIIAATCAIVTEPTPEDPDSPPAPPSEDRPGDDPADPAPPGSDGRDGGTSSDAGAEADGKSSNADGRSGVAPDQPLLSGDLLLDGSGVSPEGVPFDFQVPEVGAIPEIGILGDDDRSGMGAGSSPGTASRLAVADEQDGPERPVLLAVVLLSMVTAQLVRTWVLRKTQ